jgi:hypothetical protein
VEESGRFRVGDLIEEQFVVYTSPGKRGIAVMMDGTEVFVRKVKIADLKASGIKGSTS